MFERHVLDKLSSYLDNQLPDKQKTDVKRHLETCKICSQELAKLQIISEKIKAWRAPDLGGNFDSSVRNKIVAWELERGRVKMKKLTLTQLVPAGAIAGILVFILVLFGVQPHINRSIQGRFKDSSDTIGRQYSYDGKVNVTRTLHNGNENGEIRGGAGIDRIYQKEKRMDYRAAGISSKRSSMPAGKDENLDASDLRFSQQDYEQSQSSVIVIQPILPTTGEGQMVIRTGEILLEVSDGKVTYQKASQICQELGGYVAESNFYKDDEGKEAGRITMRIPKEKFTTALDKLSALGKLDNINTASQDISQEYANLKSRLDTTMIVYQKMIEALRNRKIEIPEAMRLESELTPVVQQIEGLKNRIEYLNNAVSFTTITLNFHEPRVSAKALNESKRIIKERLLSGAIAAVKFLATAIPVVILIGLVLIGFAIVAVIVRVFIRKLLKRG